MDKLRLALPVAVSCAVSACGGGGGGGGGPTPMPSISVSQTAIGFPPQQLGSMSVAVALTISNSGSAPLDVAAIQTTGANASAFVQIGTCRSVAAGAACTISVSFLPAAAGMLSATLSIQSNAPSAPSVALSGQGVAAASWSRLTHAPAAAVQLCLLLTDASVMCQSNQDWYRLTPTNIGSYVDATWSLYTSFPANYIPDAYASAVLADGRVVFVGGEYTTPNGQQSFTLTNMGAIFDPAAKTWQPLAPPPATGTPNHWQCIGDAPAAVLADGRLVIGSKLYQDVAVLDPATLLWAQVAASGRSDASNSEEGWTLLPDGSVLTLDVGNAPLAERLVLAPGATTGSWVAAGPTPVDLHTPTDVRDSLNAPGCPPYNPPGEMGPAMLMSSGAVFAVGANGRTATYSPANHSWVTGPSLPDGLNVEDGPAALLPNGHVLFGASPGSEGLGLQYYEFDGAQLTGTVLPVNAAADAAYFTSLLLLPNGQVLFVDASTTVQVYTPAVQTYDPAWAPSITSAPSTVSAGMTYSISGTQFNGLSPASSFGDEAQNATNYPLVRITNQASGHVLYARTHNHSSMGVATGSTAMSTSFDVPAGIESGASTLQVVANGIPSIGVSITVTP